MAKVLVNAGQRRSPKVTPPGRHKGGLEDRGRFVLTLEAVRFVATHSLRSWALGGCGRVLIASARVPHLQAADVSTTRKARSGRVERHNLLRLLDLRCSTSVFSFPGTLAYRLQSRRTQCRQDHQASWRPTSFAFQFFLAASSRTISPLVLAATPVWQVILCVLGGGLPHASMAITSMESHAFAYRMSETPALMPTSGSAAIAGR
jgi:hypothetical protein